MRRAPLTWNLSPAICLAALVAVLAAAPTQAGRTVTLAEAERVQGAVSCGAPAMSTSTWCVVQCTYFCFSTGCASCGCPTMTDPTSGIYAQGTAPCYVG